MSQKVVLFNFGIDVWGELEHVECFKREQTFDNSKCFPTFLNSLITDSMEISPS
jgi:hypothetical protein